MGKVFYNKLIRDNIQEKIEKKGETCEVRVVEEDAEFQQELLKKVAEEASALVAVRSREGFLSEYADLVVVLETLTELLGFSEDDVKNAVDKNRSKKGDFTKRHFLHWSEDSNYVSNETPQGIKENK
jgi:predicted house-cleaning noncanonical NTP pyrophosphatase (MazG superfamily)